MKLNLTVTEAFNFGLIQGHIEALEELLKVSKPDKALQIYILSKLKDLESALKQI